MTNKTFEQLNQELINKGMIFDCNNKYEECQQLEAIYPWGYILLYSCLVLSNQYRLYDNEHQLICTLDSEDDVWSITNGHLKCKRSYLTSDITKTFFYNLNCGAPIHTEDVKDILLNTTTGRFNDDRVLVLNNGTVYHKKDGCSLQVLDDASEFYSSKDYKVLDKDTYPNNIDIFNDMIVVKL